MGIEIIGSNPNTELKPAVFAKIKQTDKDEPSAKLPGDGTLGSLEERVRDKIFLNGAIKTVKNAGDLFNRRLDFRVDEETNRIVVKVIDTRTDKVIKEIPPEQLIELAAKIQEMIGLLIDEER